MYGGMIGIMDCGQGGIVMQVGTWWGRVGDYTSREEPWAADYGCALQMGYRGQNGITQDGIVCLVSCCLVQRVERACHRLRPVYWH